MEGEREETREEEEKMNNEQVRGRREKVNKGRMGRQGELEKRREKGEGILGHDDGKGDGMGCKVRGVKGEVN